MPAFAVLLDLTIFLLAAFIGALAAGLAGFAFGPIASQLMHASGPGLLHYKSSFWHLFPFETT